MWVNEIDDEQIAIETHQAPKIHVKIETLQDFIFSLESKTMKIWNNFVR